MGDVHASVDFIGEWLQVPDSIQNALKGLTDDELNLRGGVNGWSIRENVHHLMESNLAACTLVIASVNTNGYALDCSWMNFERAKQERMGYAHVPLAPAVELMSALSRYAATLIRAVPDTLGREVRLLEAPGTEPYVMTVEEMIRSEAEHGRHHLQEINDAVQKRQ